LYTNLKGGWRKKAFYILSLRAMGQRREKDYYRILQVPRRESQQGIHDAFRRLALRHHPDHAGCQETPVFREILEAYQTLSNSEARRRYDAELETERGPAEIIPIVIRRGPLRAHPFASAVTSPEPLVPEQHAEHLVPESDDTAREVLLQRRSPGVRDPEVLLSTVDTVWLRFTVGSRCPFCEIRGKDRFPCLFCG